MTIHVSGPTKIQVNLASSWIDLGFSENDQLISVTSETFITEITTTETGEVPGELVNAGAAYQIQGLLSDWSATNYALTYRHQYDSAAVGRISAIGSTLIGSTPTRLFGVRVTPLLTGKTGYEFLRCYMQELPDHQDFGNVAQKLLFRARAIPNKSTGVIFTTFTV